MMVNQEEHIDFVLGGDRDSESTYDSGRRAPIIISGTA